MTIITYHNQSQQHAEKTCEETGQYVLYHQHSKCCLILVEVLYGIMSPPWTLRVIHIDHITLHNLKICLSDLPRTFGGPNLGHPKIYKGTQKLVSQRNTKEGDDLDGAMMDHLATNSLKGVGPLVPRGKPGRYHINYECFREMFSFCWVNSL